MKLINIREDDSVATVCRSDKSEEPEHEDGEGDDNLEDSVGEESTDSGNQPEADETNLDTEE
ncbi:hypothetical protein D3C77_746520 [compost metagenome]